LYPTHAVHNAAATPRHLPPAFRALLATTTRRGSLNQPDLLSGNRPILRLLPSTNQFILNH
jgi:hypothetical protein